VTLMPAARRAPDHSCAGLARELVTSAGVDGNLPGPPAMRAKLVISGALEVHDQVSGDLGHPG
jgi:hypothetical protein